MKMYKCLAAITLCFGAIQSAQSSPWPVGVADNVSLKTNQRVFIPVLENDEGEELVLTEINTTSVSLGTVEMDAYRKALYYKSAENFTGDDSFWYAFKDSLGRTNATQVFLKVTADEEEESENFEAWPTANIDSVSIEKNTVTSIPVLENDVGDRLSLSSVNDWTVEGGRASVQGDNISYTPKTNFVGEDSFWYVFADARGRTNSTQVIVNITDDSDPSGETGITDAVHIPMHVDLLKSQHFVWGEVGGLSRTTTTRSASAGSTQLKVGSGFTVLDNQLITYKSTDGQYYTVATDQSRNNTINLKTVLPAPIAQGGEVWNFYDNGSHPNVIGFRSIADFALRNRDVSVLNLGKHVMLGDSWFSSGHLKSRLAEKLNNAQIINKAIGGRTSADILDNFDDDIANQNPDVVWLIAGTNDYYQGVSVDDYIANMKAIIEKINAIGAKAMVLDSSVAPMMYGSDSLVQRSHQYAKGLEDLLSQ